VGPGGLRGELTYAMTAVGAEQIEFMRGVELHADGHTVRMLLTFDAMHDEHWTAMASAGRESELNKLANALAVRSHR